MKPFHSFMIGTALLGSSIALAEGDVMRFDNESIGAESFVSVSRLSKAELEKTFILPDQEDVKGMEKSASRPIYDLTDSAIKWVVGYNISYMSTRLWEEMLAGGIYGLTTLSTGTPVAGSGAYHGVKTAFKVANYVVPGYESLLASSFTPLTRTVTDNLVDNIKDKAPNILKETKAKATSALKTTYKVSSNLFFIAKNKLSDFYSYYNG